MRGLLLKDFFLMKEQKMMVIIMAVVSAILLIENDNNIGFVAGYITLLCTTLMTNSISYDEAGKGLAFLFTMPCTRKQYVLEKYLLGIGTCLMGGSISIVLGTVMNMVKGRPHALAETTGIVAGCVFVGILLISVMTPIFLKLGNEKGRIAFFVMFFAVFALLALIGKSGFTENVSVNKIVGNILLPGKGWLGIVIAAAVILGISMVISIQVMLKKEY